MVNHPSLPLFKLLMWTRVNMFLTYRDSKALDTSTSKHVPHPLAKV